MVDSTEHIDYLEKIAEEVEGKFYLCILTLYPKFAEFLKVRKELDPSGMFLNEYLRELFEWEELGESTGS